MNRQAGGDYRSLRRAVSAKTAPPRPLSRREWLDLVAAGRAIGAAARGEDGGETYAGLALADIAHLARKARGTTFPAPGLAAAAMAEAFARLAIALGDTFDPEPRTILATLVGHAAAALEEILDVARWRAADAGRRIMGEQGD